MSNASTITTLTNSGTTSGGDGGNGIYSQPRGGGTGGAGVSNAGMITTLSNSGAISAGNGGSG